MEPLRPVGHSSSHSNWRLKLVTVLTYFMVNIGKKVSLKNRLTIQAAFKHSSLGGLVRMVLLVIKGTFLCEAMVPYCFFLFSKQGIIWYKSIFYGVFHSVSAFCNAGFDVIGGQSLMPYCTDLNVNLVIMALIITGGIGFTVWKDIVNKTVHRFSPRIKQKHYFSLHTRLALIMTGILIVSGTVFFLVVEYNNPATLGVLAFPQKLLAALFQSVTLRTAGFAYIAQDD
jgi:trk system potassium uptake protein TrkH